MRLAVVFLVLISIFGCYANTLKSIVQGNDKFTEYTYKKLMKISGKEENIIFSGLSAEVILSLLANGARGTTRKQLLKGLSLPQKIKSINEAYRKLITGLEVNEDEYNVKLANKIYLAQNFLIKKQFNDIAVNNYAAEVENIDFSQTSKAANLMNSWVEEKTNNRITNLIDPQNLNPSTVIVLINALYFSGKWKNPFSPMNTAKRTFYNSPAESKKITTMYTESIAKYAYNEKLKAKFLELSFNNGNTSITFVLPDKIDGLSAVEQNLKLYLAPQTMESARVAITLPKFTIETEIDFKPILQSLGVRKMFKPGNELSNISNGTLQVDFVLQKAFIDVNENGVEAAAATAVNLMPVSLYEPPVKFIFDANHPFYFYIRDLNTDLTLFSGRFLN
ncbi:alaserpin-like isoform X2 [Diabrotica undecimpunctata]|uniref:alaserpin-like isoform X2 n=1 Tax=Diabrotica undecimpunctata TaxID=50387 RepID=UPI003B64250B